MPRKGENIYKRKDGRWEGRYKVGNNDSGTAKYRSVYGKTYQSVKEKLTAFKAAPAPTNSSGKLTVKELFEEWFAAVKLKVKESTYANYRMKADKHILPEFGGLHYERLTAQMLHNFIESKLKIGLSAKYVSDIIIVFKSMAKYISRVHGFRNPLADVILPKSEKKEMRLFSDHQQEQLCRYLLKNTDKSSIGVLLSLYTGLRIGEVCGLKWSDIDFEKSILTVRRTVQRIRTGIHGTKLMATQGDKNHNYNNHPFSGTARDKSFAFAHNGVLWNDRELRHDKKLPDTYIETDSYIAVQLLESQDKLNFDSLRYMAETVEGNFTFTVLEQDNSLYIIKGSNPMCLLHFESLGLYIYASTESIMKNALRKVGLYKFSSEKIEVDEGDILCINKTGEITRSEFEPKLYRSKYMSWYGDDEPYYNVHEEMLLAYCGCYGVDSSDVELLLEYGYTCDEIEDMLADHALLHETLQAIKFEDDESLYESCYGGICL